MNTDNTQNDAPLSFEDALKRLEEIVHLLEGGDVGLDEALKRYEEGVVLLRQSYEILRAERRIELLSGVDAEGNPITQPFDDTATIDQDEGKDRGRRRRSSTGKATDAQRQGPIRSGAGAGRAVGGMVTMDGSCYGGAYRTHPCKGVFPKKAAAKSPVGVHALACRVG